MRVFTWEMRHKSKRTVDHLLVDCDLFSMVRGPSTFVTCTSYGDEADAFAGAARMTGLNERDGYVLQGGIWTCDVEVDVRRIQTLIDQQNHVRAARTLDPIIKAARIIGALEL